LGGSGSDEAYALAIHPKTGDVYVAGATDSEDFPKTTGGAQKRCNNCAIDPEEPSGDVFVARLNKDLTLILQSTYLGGSGTDRAYALAIHPKTGEVYMAGVTKSKNFPKTTGGAQESISGFHDAFVSRLNKELTQILQSTYLGGNGEDFAHALVIHPQTGEIYVAGETLSTNFPKTAGGAQAGHHGGLEDAFVARLNTSLTQILQSTYLGGSNGDYAYALAIHPTTGDVYVAGFTLSTNFPKTTGGAQAQAKYRKGIFPPGDAFVARLNKDLIQILQSTYLGGSGTDRAKALAIHPKTGEVYVAGETESTDFPSTNGGAQETYVSDKGNAGGKEDAFVARLNKELTQILQATYLGGIYSDRVYALAIHPTTGDVYVAGSTFSPNFPKTTGGAQPIRGGVLSDAFVARLNSNLTQILQSTYLGGSSSDDAHALAIHPKTGEVYVAGVTYSKDFPQTAGGAQAGHRGDFEDAFVARLTADLAAGRSSGGGGVSPMTASASSTASFWSILLLLSVPAFALARRIRRK
jgi:secreted PhoX family phosphatase